MKYLTRIFYTIFIVCFSNIVCLSNYINNTTLAVIILSVLFLFINILPSFHNLKVPSFRLRICGDGCELLIIFLISTAFSVILQIANIIKTAITPNSNIGVTILAILFCILIEGVIFWNGIIRVYCTSVQLGIKIRVIGALCGMIPIVHIFVLYKIIRTALAEVKFEADKIKLNNQRKSAMICKTKYPVLLVHGVFFRDYKLLNYWGRIPDELQKNGAVIYYGKHESASPVIESGCELAQRIKEIVSTTGCGKVNIIAHSKGGLDCRYAISKLGMSQYVASLTTINTPHRGCLFVDNLLNIAPQGLKQTIANTYNSTAKRIGDKNPDFMLAVQDLTDQACKSFNSNVPDSPDVYYQSVGSKLNKAGSGKFPLNVSYPLVKHYVGANDGLVAEPSFPWGSSFTFLTVKGNRGISHGDMIDLNRENIPGFDVREFYVQLVADLKAKGF